MQSIQNPWVLTPDEALSATGGSPDGLTTASAQQRLIDWGPNVLRTKDIEPWYMLLLQQFANPLVYMLIGAKGIKAYFKGAVDAALIGAVVLFMAIIGCVQVMKARKAMAALLQLSAPKANVLRDGNTVLMDAAGPAPGVILVLEAGDRIAADARLLEIANIRINEFAFKGKWICRDSLVHRRRA